MTKLKTFILDKYVKKSKKLQEINKIVHKREQLFYSAVTIVDVIDNAEYLFGSSTGKYIGCTTDTKYAIISSNILDMCFQNKSIEDISEYIIKNIK